MKRIILGIAALVGFAVSSTAWAQEYEPVVPYGLSLSAGGGVTNFTAARTDNATEVGGYWDVRATWGSRYYFGAEAAYVGSAQGTRALGLDSHAFLARNGLEADARINLPIERGKYLIEPFVFGGVGWGHYSLENTSTTTSAMINSDDVLLLPVGIGAELGYGHLVLDGRFTYRPTFEDQMMTGGGDNGLQNWSAGMLIGYQF